MTFDISCDLVLNAFSPLPDRGYADAVRHDERESAEAFLCNLSGLTRREGAFSVYEPNPAAEFHLGYLMMGCGLFLLFSLIQIVKVALSPLTGLACALFGLFNNDPWGMWFIATVPLLSLLLLFKTLLAIPTALFGSCMCY